ncbi:hypothetical protein [Nitrosophilus kaiyonis]|uniref:hypothetical protein n=1 Tax=Nitrosophilus kaiyonis TaxID=2930200 RepID=UPI002491C08F|nr:hypothetical protein [Nitrosophilus kaiyonis]
MKKLIYILILSLFFVGCEKIGVYKEGNKEGKPLEFKKGEVQCVECTMALETKEHSAQAVLPNGRTYFFDDPGCMALWFKKQKDKDKIKLWIYTDDTKRYIDARKAWYKLGDQTPMNYGFGAYEKKVKGAVDFDTFLIMMYRGENLTNPAIRKKVMGE